MKLYFAPMEGITSYIFRNAHAEIFGMCDKYFAPFIVPTENERISLKTLRDVLRINNTTKLTPQLLCSNGEAFVKFSEKLRSIGYEEVNINLGCPSGTVVKKSRGAGALKDPETLEIFLDYIFSNTKIDISIKTRAGFSGHDEFERLLEIFNKYPAKELIIHPRVREEYYKGVPNMETFDKAYNDSDLSLCYNGNVFSVDDYTKIVEKYHEIDSVMIGRGAIINPAIFREIRGGEKLKTGELIEFSETLEQRYLPLLKCEKYTLHRLKEFWILAMSNFPEEKKILKAIKKSNRISELDSAIKNLPEL